MFRLLLLALIIFGYTSAAAVRVNSIYQAEVPVQSQAPEEREKAFQQGFLEVLIKASGKTKIAEDPLIKQHLRQPTALIQEYSYVESDPLRNQLPYLLKVHYDAQGIDRLLRKAKLPIWGMERPLILGWIQYEEANKPAELIDSSSNNEILNIIKQRMDLRGIPFMLPIMDVTDLDKISLKDIEIFNVSNLQKAAKRYTSEGILVMKVSGHMPKGFITQAKLVLGDNNWDFNLSGMDLEKMISNLVDSVTVSIAEKYYSQQTKSIHATVMLKIKNINEEKAFSALEQYLQRIPGVASAQTVIIAGDEVELNISLNGSRDAFKQAVSSDKKLTFISAESNDSILVYHWNQ